MHITEFNKVTCAYAQSIWLYLTLCYSLDCSPSGSSVHGILQTRTLEWVARPSPGNFPNPGIELKSPASSALQGDSWPLSHQSLSVTKHACFHAKLLQLCPTLCDPMDCSPPGSSVSGILQARILQWVSISSSRGSSQPRDQRPFCCTAGGSPASQADSLWLSLPGSPFFFRKGSKRKKHSILPSSHVLRPPRLFRAVTWTSPKFQSHVQSYSTLCVTERRADINQHRPQCPVTPPDAFLVTPT